MQPNVQEQVIAILAEQALMDPKDIALDATLESLGIDSLGLVEAVFAIEETFDVQVPFNANTPQNSAFDITSVRSVIRSIETLIDGS